MSAIPPLTLRGETAPELPESVLVSRMALGDCHALAAVFLAYRDRLWRMAHVRLDRRLAARIDADDVLQEAWVAALRRLSSFDARSDQSVFVWLRLIVGQTMIDLYRQHMGAGMRRAALEVPLRSGAPGASSDGLSLHLLASQTSPSQAAIRGESAASLASALASMDPIDREILTLRHFEELSNGETAAVLGLQKTAASNRYIRAIERLRGVLFHDGPAGRPSC